MSGDAPDLDEAIKIVRAALDNPMSVIPPGPLWEAIDQVVSALTYRVTLEEKKDG